MSARLSEVINRLNDLYAQHGDLEMEDGDGFAIENVRTADYREYGGEIKIAIVAED